jgi:Uma2 family endonuclease
MSKAERDEFYDQVFAATNDPVEAMSEGRPHRYITTEAYDALTRHFRTIGRSIYVADDLAVIYPGEPVFDPDLLAVLDVAQPEPEEDERMAWVVADEGKGPDLVLEVMHQGNRNKDLVRNVALYARLGIREYFIYDRQYYKLYGYRLPAGGAAYRELRPRLGRISSEVLGLDLALVDRRLRFFSGMGELMNSQEFIERLSKMMDSIEARAQQAEAQAQEAQVQAQQAQAQVLVQARQAVLDLAEAYGLDVSEQQRQTLHDSSLAELEALRHALKSRRAWP